MNYYEYKVFKHKNEILHGWKSKAMSRGYQDNEQALKQHDFNGHEMPGTKRVMG